MQNLVEKILRSKIYNTIYWKEHCFALTAESLVDKAVDLHFVGGTYGGQVRLTLVRFCKHCTRHVLILNDPAIGGTLISLRLEMLCRELQQSSCASC